MSASSRWISNATDLNRVIQLTLKSRPHLLWHQVAPKSVFSGLDAHNNSIGDWSRHSPVWTQQPAYFLADPLSVRNDWVRVRNDWVRVCYDWGQCTNSLRFFPASGVRQERIALQHRQTRGRTKPSHRRAKTSAAAVNLSICCALSPGLPGRERR
jgi:hypothetical protein